MKFSYIGEFIVLAETEEYLQAAESLSISQASLSKHIKSIEQEFGVTLFNRTTRKVEINEFGKIFLNYANELLCIQKEIMSVVSRGNTYKYKLTVGLTPSMTYYKIVNALIELMKIDSNVSVSLIEDDTKNLKDQVRNNLCDFAFVQEFSVTEDTSLIRIPYTSERLSAVLPLHHPLANEKYISLDQIKNENFILLPKYSPVYNLCMSAFHKIDIEPKIVYLSSNINGIHEFVTQGLGISLLLKKPSFFKSHNHNICMVDIEPEIDSYINLIYRQDNTSPVINYFLDIIRPYFNNISF